MLYVTTDIHVMFIVIYYITLNVNFYEAWAFTSQTNYAIALENHPLM